MNWLPASEADTMIGENFDGAVIINDLADKASIQYFHLANRQYHNVDYLLKHYYD